jgi:excinuclease ABC subunit C
MNSITIDHLPSLPGVYLFKDANNAIIYIGKAKSLKARVKSYFQNKTDWKVQSLLEEAASLEHIITKTEVEAMLLEAELIGIHKPRFNVLLKSGQPFVYILFSKSEPPTIEIVRNKTKKGTYFGPFLHKGQARGVVRFLIETFKLKLCNKQIANGCLDYHIGLCAGSCMGTFDMQDYHFRIELAKNALRKNQEAFLRDLDARIKEHARLLQFEKAKMLHTYLLQFDTIFKTLAAKYDSHKYESAVFDAMQGTKDTGRQNDQLAYDLQELLQADKPIVSIDCFDISHFQSSYIVGSAVRFTNGMPDKNSFRRFKIRTLTQQDDYAALREIVTRRYRNPEEIPDLILIDGGKGQLNAVKDLLPGHICVSLAKREELLYTPLHPQGIQLNVATNVGKTLIALRDYAHHVAVSYHTLRRNKQLSSK